MSGKEPNTFRIPRDRWAWMWIAYSGFLFIQPLLDNTLRCWLVTLASFAVFLAVYAVYLRTQDGGPLRFWLIGSLFVLGLVTFPFNNGASTFFVYVASFLPFSIVSKRTVLLLYVAESVVIVGEHYAFAHAGHDLTINWPNTLIAVFLVWLIGGGNIFFAEQKRADCKLRMANEEIEALAAVAERERIARDLHDVLGHTLSVIVLKAELAKRLVATQPERAAAEMGDVERTARTALAEVREAIGGYRTRGLAAEVEAARRALDSAGVALHAEVTAADFTGLSAGEETVLALALREAVTNIVRHAQAQNCTLRFVSRDGRRRLVVEDDGSHPMAREGNGLRGMRERVESLGGSLRVERERGTRLLIELPMSANAMLPVSAGAMAS